VVRRPHIDTSLETSSVLECHALRRDVPFDGPGLEQNDPLASGKVTSNVARDLNICRMNIREHPTPLADCDAALLHRDFTLDRALDEKIFFTVQISFDGETSTDSGHLWRRRWVDRFARFGPRVNRQRWSRSFST